MKKIILLMNFEKKMNEKNCSSSEVQNQKNYQPYWVEVSIRFPSRRRFYSKFPTFEGRDILKMYKSI